MPKLVSISITLAPGTATLFDVARSLGVAARRSQVAGGGTHAADPAPGSRCW